MLKILLVVLIFLVPTLKAEAQERQNTETRIDGVVSITFEHSGIWAVTSEKTYQVQDWANSFAKAMTPNREICPICTPMVNINLIPSKDGKMSIVAKAEMWGEVKVTITLAP